MEPFRPAQIYVDSAVRDTPLTERVLSYFQDVPWQVIENPANLKKPMPLTLAKKKLLITKHKGDVVKTCQGFGDYVCCNLLTASLVSNCHLECTYCILQDYLKNNPILTFFANVDEILGAIKNHISKKPDVLFRLGTGELSDSLALDAITQFSHDLVPFAAQQKNLLLELKTKSDQVDNLLELDHNGKTIVSWSVNPQAYIDHEEFKTASLHDRLNAARRCAHAGYKIGFHLDPLLAFEDWEKQYEQLVNVLREQIHPHEMAYFSMGTLRFTPGLKQTSLYRFPKSKIFTGELFPSKDGKTRYLRDIREEMYKKVRSFLDQKFPEVPHYLCMETKEVWKETYQYLPKTTGEMENKIVRGFGV